MATFIKYIVLPLLVATILGSVQAAPAFPVSYSANNRYLVDQNGTPFPIMGRTAWFVLSLSVGDYHTFIDDTAARGYSAIELHVVNHDPRGNNPPFNGNGDLPFLKRLDGTTWDGVLCCSAPDFTTPNEVYWSFVDGFLSYCESKGILVFLFPAYVGFQGGDQGWMQEIVANGTTKMQTYGAWIATRYKNQKNLVWMMGGDMGTPPYPFNSTQTSVENALLTGLKSVTGQQSTLFSAEWVRGSIATDQTTFGTSMTLNGVYSNSDDVNTQGRRAYAYSPIEPAYLLEEPYDEEGPDGNNVNGNATQPVRRFQWWGWLSTIGGYISGNGYVWPFVAPAWLNHLDTQGSRDMARLNAFMGSIAWYNLVPSGLGGMRTLITVGGSSANLSDYVAAAAAPNGMLMVAYIPPDHSGSITVDMGVMSGPTRARWFDPTSGAYTSIGTGLPNTGSRVFTAPGNNSAGANDWVLVLDYTIGNTSPTISSITNQTVNEDMSTGPVSFTIGDAETAAGSLTLGKGSSNLALLPTNSIVFGGSGSNRTVTVTPAANQNGAATITVSVSDGQLSTSNSFVLTVNAVNDVPTISTITNRIINEDTSAGPISFTVGDAETAAGSLTLSGNSSNTNLVTTNSIVFGGSGTNRTVTVTPAANQTGVATIKVSVSDGQLSASNSFVLTVNAVNDAPAISSITNQTINEDMSTGPVSFMIGDAETAVGSLTLGKGSSNLTLVPISNIVFGGSGSNRTVTVTPVTNQSGVATITISVSDGQLSASNSFVLTVNAVNDTPTISAISNQTISVNGTAGPLNITVGDVETAAGSLTLSGNSSNPTLVTTNNIIFGGSGANRTVTVTPAAGQSGNATITVSVSDGQLSASNSFVLTVSTQPAGTRSFTNKAGITIPGLGNGTPYPSVINVAGMGGTISQVTVTLRGISHNRMRDIDILLVGPGGQKIIVLSDVGPNSSVNNITLTLSDAAVTSLGTGTLVSGTYKPTNITVGDSFESPAPGGPYGTNFAIFNGQSANGTWSLYVKDDTAGSQGSMAGGWSLTITTVLSVPSNPPQITSITFDGQGSIQVTVSGEIGFSYALQASSDQLNWTNVSVKTNQTGSIVFSEQPTTNSIRFYRAMSMPQ